VRWAGQLFIAVVILIYLKNAVDAIIPPKLLINKETYKMTIDRVMARRRQLSKNNDATLCN